MRWRARGRQADALHARTVIDRFTHFTLQFLERVTAASEATLAQLFDSCVVPRARAVLQRASDAQVFSCSQRSYDKRLLQSTATPRVDLFRRRLSDVKITDFFGERRGPETEHPEKELLQARH